MGFESWVLCGARSLVELIGKLVIAQFSADTASDAHLQYFFCCPMHALFRSFDLVIISMSTVCPDSFLWRRCVSLHCTQPNELRAQAILREFCVTGGAALQSPKGRSQTTSRGCLVCACCVVQSGVV
mmetsp:Transcript_52787/g.147032  ORF Transcript_52787/g.147032 Transcript_52787/m.147032 type:complete len:127 (+) Transcript_52787:1614-1994(+)